ncbi:MAG: hypothetical protein PVI90_12975 [Desulfobacteraceae bacterium]|jgi:hypothetical protein
MDNPYLPAIQWIRNHPDDKKAIGLSKLILSLWNEEVPFGLRECIDMLDNYRMIWALKIITHFIEHGDDRYLFDAGDVVRKMYPPMWEIARSGANAKIAAAKEMEFI